MNNYAQRIYEGLQQELPWQTEFLQSVFEVFDSLGLLLDSNAKYQHSLPCAKHSQIEIPENR